MKIPSIRSRLVHLGALALLVVGFSVVALVGSKDLIQDVGVSVGVFVLCFIVAVNAIEIGGGHGGPAR